MFNPSDIKNILIIRPSALGDVARSVPAAVSIKKQFPHAQLHWMVQQNFADILQEHPAIDQVIDFNRNALKSYPEFKQFIQWIKQLRQKKYDLVIDLQGLLRSGIITKLTGAKHRLGYKNAREFAWLGYNIKFKTDHAQHAVDQMLTLLQHAQIPTTTDLKLYTSPQACQWRNEYLKTIPTDQNRYTLIAPTARWLCKCWPIEKYIQIINQLLTEKIAGEKIIILASPSEQKQIKPIRDAFPKSHDIDYPQTTISQMMALIQSARLIVCNDSAPLHIAVGFSKPIVALFGPTDPAKVGPYQRPHTLVQPQKISPAQMKNYRKQKNDQSLISQISTQQVWQTILDQIKKHPL